jgi:mRNA deadenylase 3'-5' endonuclease subunit Ccr4
MNSDKFNATTKAHMKRDNVAIIATLQPKATDNEQESEKRQRVIVATTHFYWDPKFAHVKTEQAKMLLDRVRDAHSSPGSGIYYNWLSSPSLAISPILLVFFLFSFYDL